MSDTKLDRARDIVRALAAENCTPCVNAILADGHMGTCLIWRAKRWVEERGKRDPDDSELPESRCMGTYARHCKLEDGHEGPCLFLGCIRAPSGEPVE